MHANTLSLIKRRTFHFVFVYRVVVVIAVIVVDCGVCLTALTTALPLAALLIRLALFSAQLFYNLVAFPYVALN